MSSQTNSRIDQLHDKARAAAAAGRGGSGLNTVVIISGILSAIFFLQQSGPVFSGIWRPAALALGLLVGLVPSEFMYFAWRRVRATKSDLTSAQLTATAAGIITAVSTSVFSTLALFVVTFEHVPADIRQYSDWIAFVALSFPIVMQLVIVAYYSINETTVLQNHARAQLNAMAFDAHLRFEAARMQSVLDGTAARLSETLPDYGSATGAAEADRILSDGIKQLSNVRQEEPEAAENAPEPVAHRNGVSSSFLSGNGRQA